MSNVERMPDVTAKNTFGPLEEEQDDAVYFSTEDDSKWPRINPKPTNNRAGPKKAISLVKALKKKDWKPVMIDKELPDDPKTKMIAPVLYQWQGSEQQAKWQQQQQQKQQTRQQQAPARTAAAPARTAAPTYNTLMCNMKMHTTCATKFLASVGKMTQNGNRVVFDADRSYIVHKKTGREMEMKLENGVYKLDVIFMNGVNAERGKIVVDSGAADNVMPMTALSEVELQPREEGANFSAANGKKMENTGRKDVKFIPFNQWEAEFGFPFQGRAE